MKALVFYGGWDGHTPDQMAKLLSDGLRNCGFEVELSQTVECLADKDNLAGLDLIMPVWTMGEMKYELYQNLSAAIQSGVGFGGVHGGTGDAFRGNVEYGWLTGGQFVGHPHVGDYEVRLTTNKSAITDAMPQSWKYNSEQYYMIVDPGLTVLADTLYEHEGKRTIMPVVWTKTWGKGRVFYSALGHTAAELASYPQVLEMSLKGLAWAAQGKKA